MDVVVTFSHVAIQGCSPDMPLQDSEMSLLFVRLILAVRIILKA